MPLDCIDQSASRIIIRETSLAFFITTKNTLPIRPSFLDFGAYNMQYYKIMI